MSDSFKAFVLDQLHTLPDLRARAMFGGHGLYQADRFFGILFGGRLYFKVDKLSRRSYIERDSEPFTYQRAGRTMTMDYYEVPSDVLETRDELVAWAERAIRSSRPRKARRRAAR